MNEEQIQKLIKDVTSHFRTFGAGAIQEIVSDPIAHVLKDQPPRFAVAVSVEDVVRFVVSKVENREP